MEQPPVNADNSLRLSIPLGHLQYVSSATPITPAEHTQPTTPPPPEAAPAPAPKPIPTIGLPPQAWAAAGVPVPVPGQALSATSAAVRLRDAIGRWAPAQWRVPAVVGIVALGLGGWGATQWPNAHTAAVAVLPPPVETPALAEGAGVLENVATPYRSAAVDRVTIDVAQPSAQVETHEPIGVPPLPTLKPAAAAPAPPAASVQAAKPAKGGDADGKDRKAKHGEEPGEVSHVVVDEAPPSAPPVRKAPSPPAAAAAPAAPAIAPPSAGKPPRLLAVLPSGEVVVTDPATGLPKPVRVGAVLPNGAKLLSVNAAAGTAVTEQGTLKLD